MASTVIFCNLAYILTCQYEACRRIKMSLSPSTHMHMFTCKCNSLLFPRSLPQIEIIQFMDSSRPPWLRPLCMKLTPPFLTKEGRIYQPALPTTPTQSQFHARETPVKRHLWSQPASLWRFFIIRYRSMLP